MSVRQLWEGCDAAVWAQRLDGRTKLLGLFLVAVLAIVVDNPRTLFLLFTATLLLHLFARTSVYKWQVLAILLLFGLWGSMFSQAFFFAQTPRTPLFVLIEPTVPVLGSITGGLYVYREGVVYGAVQGLRSATMLALGLFVCWTSDPRQLLKALMAWRYTGRKNERCQTFTIYSQTFISALFTKSADIGAFCCQQRLFSICRTKERVMAE